MDMAPNFSQDLSLRNHVKTSMNLNVSVNAQDKNSDNKSKISEGQLSQPRTPMSKSEEISEKLLDKTPVSSSSSERSEY